MIPNSYRTNLPCKGCEKYNGTTFVTTNATITGSTVAGCPHIRCPYESQFEYTYSVPQEPPEIQKPKPTDLQKHLQKQAWKAIQNSHRRK